MRISPILVLASFWHMGKSIIPLCSLDATWGSNGFHREIGYPTKTDDTEFKYVFKVDKKDDDNCMIKVKQNDKNISFNLTNYSSKYKCNRKVVKLQHKLSLTEGQVTFEFANKVTRQLYLYFQNPILQENPFLLDLVDKGENFSLPMTERFSQCLNFRQTYDESFEDPKKFSVNLKNAGKVIEVNVKEMIILVQMNINYPIDEIFTITCNFMRDMNINEALKVKFLYPINKKENEVQIVDNIIHKGDNFSVSMTNRFSQCLDYRNTVNNESYEDQVNPENASKVIKVNVEEMTILVEMNIEYPIEEMLTIICNFTGNINEALKVKFLYPSKRDNQVQIVDNIIHKGDNFSVSMTNRFGQCLDFPKTVYNESFDETLVTDCSYGNDTKNACKVIDVNLGNTTLLLQMNIDYLVDEMLILTCKFNPNIKAVLMVQFQQMVNANQIQLEEIGPQLAIFGVLMAMMVCMVVIYFKLNKKKECNQLVQVNSFNPSTLLQVESRQDSESEEEESTLIQVDQIRKDSEDDSMYQCLLKLEGFSEDIIKSPSDIVKGQFLGEGAFGQVYSGFLNIGGTTR
jgi:hypothetical protein